MFPVNINNWEHGERSIPIRRCSEDPGGLQVAQHRPRACVFSQVAGLHDQELFDQMIRLKLISPSLRRRPIKLSTSNLTTLNSHFDDAICQLAIANVDQCRSKHFLLPGRRNIWD